MGKLGELDNHMAIDDQTWLGTQTSADVQRELPCPMAPHDTANSIHNISAVKLYSPVSFAAVGWDGLRSGASPRAVLLLLLRLAVLTMATAFSA